MNELFNTVNAICQSQMADANEMRPEYRDDVSNEDTDYGFTCDCGGAAAGGCVCC